jgi:SAM-dependent methyltransferase
MNSDRIVSANLARHYLSKVKTHGAEPKGVDWPTEELAAITYTKILGLIRDRHRKTRPSLLDIGCGYGGFLEFAKEAGQSLDYTGIDIVPEMIEHARRRSSDEKFILGDAIDFDFGRRFDYVVCIGIMTMKIMVGMLDMARYSHRLIRRMFDVADVGIAFTTMTNQVNYMVDTSQYRSPVELLAFCLSELSTKVIIDHAYERYEFTTYVFRENAI